MSSLLTAVSSRLDRRFLVLGFWGLVGLAALVIILVELASTVRPFGFSLAATVTNGLQFGAVYSLVALGVALIYKSTKVINFAQGELGTVPAFLVLWVLLGFNLESEIDPATVSNSTFLLATVGAVLFGALLAMAINVGIVQRLAQASAVTSLVATAGVALLLVSFESIFFKVRDRKFPRFIEGAPMGFEAGPFCFSQLDQSGACLGSDGRLALGGEVVPWNTFLVVGLLVVVSLALAAFFRSPAGIALLATSQEPTAAELYGISPLAMSSLAWGFAGAFAALAGVLGAGVFEAVRPGLMTSTFLIPGLVAAVLGGITSMVGAVVGGLVVGVVFSLSTSLVLELNLNSTIPGPPFLAVFVVLVIVLLVRPQGLLGKSS
jgi:branched-chain amino acid transport system permease protein